MVDNTTENDGDEFDIIETDTIPAAGAEQVETDDEDDGDDTDDDRLADSQDDLDDDIEEGKSKNRQKRVKRRELQRRAKEAADRELEFLRQQNAEMLRRIQAVEGHAISTNEQSIDARYQQALNEVRQAEHIMARAAEAGNGDDMIAAMRIRDEAMSAAQQLQGYKQQVAQAREQVSKPQIDPRVTNYAAEWVSANPWYDPNGRDEDSRITKAIDDGLVREGYNPATRTYWEELTRRVAARVGDGDAPEAADARPKRKAPPTGNSREHAPSSTRKEVYVTPERKAAMMEAGIWDDPVARNRMLKAYQTYDKQSSAR
ncbi:MAG: hypothetical protein RJA99_1416 [Pseudomonadota bacterium]|jgi:hypothetical protein